MNARKWSPITWALVAGGMGGMVTVWPDLLWSVSAAAIALCAACLAPIWSTNSKRRLVLQRRRELLTAGGRDIGAKLIEEARLHREWLASSVRTAAWVVGLVVTVGLGIAVWVLGDSAKAAASDAATRMVASDPWRPILHDVAIGELNKIVPEMVESMVGDALDRSAPRKVEEALAPLVAAKVRQLNGVEPQQIIRQFLAENALAVVPRFCVLPFLGRREDVPEGWIVMDQSVDIPESAQLRLVFPNGRQPDLSGRMLVGATPQQPPGALGGARRQVIAARSIAVVADATAEYERNDAGSPWMLNQREHEGRFVIDTKGSEMSVGRPQMTVRMPQEEVEIAPPAIAVLWIMRVR